MSQSTSKAARRAALAKTAATPETLAKAPRVQRPLPTYAFVGTNDVAHLAVGHRRFEVVAPRTKAQVHAPDPQGPTSIEYAAPDAIEAKHDEFDPIHNERGRRPFADVLKQVQAEFAFAPLC